MTQSAAAARQALDRHRVRPRSSTTHIRSRTVGVVDEWNTPGRHAAEAAGFVPTATHEVDPGNSAKRYIVFAQPPP